MQVNTTLFLEKEARALLALFSSALEFRHCYFPFYSGIYIFIYRLNGVLQHKRQTEKIAK